MCTSILSVIKLSRRCSSFAFCNQTVSQFLCAAVCVVFYFLYICHENRERSANSPARVYFPGAVRFPIDRREAAAHSSPYEAQMDSLLRLRTPQANDSSSSSPPEDLGEVSFPQSETKHKNRRNRTPVTSSNKAAEASSTRGAASKSSSCSRLKPQPSSSINFPSNELSFSSASSATSSRGGTGWPVRFEASEAAVRASELLLGTAAVSKTASTGKLYSSSKSHFGKALGTNESSLFPEKSRNLKDYYALLNAK